MGLSEQWLLFFDDGGTEGETAAESGEAYAVAAGQTGHEFREGNGNGVGRGVAIFGNVVEHFFVGTVDGFTNGFDDAFVGLVGDNVVELVGGNTAVGTGLIEHFNHFTDRQFENGEAFHFDVLTAAEVGNV